MLDDVILVIRYTRNWIQYGLIGHSVVCIVVAAVKGLLEQLPS